VQNNELKYPIFQYVPGNCISGNGIGCVQEVIQKQP